MSLNKFFLRASRAKLPDGGLTVGARAASAANSGLKYLDRLSGMSATKMRNRANYIDSIYKSQGGADARLEGLSKALHNRAQSLHNASIKTRMKTGLAGAGIVGAAAALPSAPKQDAYADFSAYDSGAYGGSHSNFL